MRQKVRYCDTDHTVDWAKGGETNATNLSHLCRNHHRLKHETGWNVTQAGDGELVWTSPAGMVYTTVPEYPETSNAPEQQKQKTQKSAPNRTDPWNAQAGDYEAGNNPAPF